MSANKCSGVANATSSLQANIWDKADAWFIEDERVFHRIPDPYHRVDVYEASREATVTLNGEVIARTDRAKILYETGLAPRVYIPGGDVVREDELHGGEVLSQQFLALLRVIVGGFFRRGVLSPKDTCGQKPAGQL